MSLLKFLSGPTPEKLEAQGDARLASGLWGQAKILYERALHKHESSGGREPNARRRLQDKIRQTRQALAQDHRQTAMTYLDGGYVAEARELLVLAMEISEDKAFRDAVAHQVAALDRPAEQPPDIPGDAGAAVPAPEDQDDRPHHDASPGEYFRALCHTLPAEVSRAYRSYGRAFRDGYIALNNGDFDTAIRHLEQAMADHPQPESYIPLELATAYMNTNRLGEARELLEQVRRHHPEALPVYRHLCEIYWEQGEPALAEALLASLPPHLAQSRAVMLLKGETLYRSGRFGEARDYYRRSLEDYGWHDRTAQGLAQAHEALDDRAAARTVYRELLERGRGCPACADPWMTHKYAELSYAEGHRGSDLLELYLTLARDMPANCALYYDRISRIYAARGNPLEAERFRALARQARPGGQSST
jgi:Tfp pilus assembly protein PilF